MKMSDQIRKAIEASTLTRAAICRTIGIPESTMSQFMHGKCSLSFNTLDKLGHLLGLWIVADKRKGRGESWRA